MMITTNHTLCQSANHIRLTLLHFGHALVGKEWRGSSGGDAFSRLYYIMNGSATVTPTDGEPLLMKKGYWVLLPAGCAFSFCCPKEMEQLYFHLKICDLDGLDLLSSHPFPCVLETEEEKSDFFLKSIHTTDVSKALSFRHEVEGILLAMLEKHGITVESYTFSPCIVKAIKYIKRHLSAQLTISEIAEQVFVSNSTLTKRFKAELSKSVREYVNDIILFEAAQLLLKTNLSVLAISERFGFSDQFYFSRRFKQKYGVSPMKYRKTAVL